ncbi:MAG: reverse transcriptase domain-containing protein [Coxiellaceae bacterium]|nr:reverse transcriptase domain-containing protein [Coxiellaceae bacterium]
MSPVLSNLFLHYVFDLWMTRQYPNLPWCRYADDGLVHCKTEHQAKQLFEALRQRFEECLLEIHPIKSKIVYCKDDNRRRDYSNTKFTFLGYDFRRRSTKNTKDNKMFLSFNAAVSNAAKKSMRAKTKETIKNIGTYKSLNDVAQKFNPILQGWINYYGKYQKSALRPVFRHFNKSLVRWIMRKFKRFKGHKTKAATFLEGLLEKQPTMFAHWETGFGEWFA